jgi:hypothetical protein
VLHIRVPAVSYCAWLYCYCTVSCGTSTASNFIRYRSIPSSSRWSVYGMLPWVSFYPGLSRYGTYKRTTFFLYACVPADIVLYWHNRWPLYGAVRYLYRLRCYRSIPSSSTLVCFTVCTGWLHIVFYTGIIGTNVLHSVPAVSCCTVLMLMYCIVRNSTCTGFACYRSIPSPPHAGLFCGMYFWWVYGYLLV